MTALACQDVAAKVATRYSDYQRAVENEAIRDNVQLARETRGEDAGTRAWWMVGRLQDAVDATSRRAS